MIMQLQLDIRDSWGKRAIKKIKRTTRLLRKVMVILYKGLPHPKGKMSAWAPNAKQELTRAPMYGQALPFTSCHKLYHSHDVTSKTTRKFHDKIEWVRS